jgi:hypothetical protein
MRTVLSSSINRAIQLQSKLLATHNVGYNLLMAYFFRWIDFTQAKDAQLENLFKACEAATFGLEHKDVLDKSYRKARKMDVDHFAMHFSPDNLGIVGVVSDFLLRGRTGQKTINSELYKLNVYGKQRPM